MKVAFLIRSLETGGAERQLTHLARGLAEQGVEVSIGVFYRGGSLENELPDGAVRIVNLAKRGRWDLWGFLVRARAWLKQESPDILHGYLPGANIMAVLLTRFLPDIRLVWGIRASDMSVVDYGAMARMERRVSAWLSRFPDLIIVNSESGLRYHQQRGYPAGRMCVISNGVDTQRFRPDQEARRRTRDRWGVDEDTIIVGMAGRIDPVKDIETFLHAAVRLMKKRERIRFVCMGDGDQVYLRDLQRKARELGLADRMSWYPARDDVESAYNAFDVLVSSSLSEGLSNTLLEGLACGVPCVATDVGDARMVLTEPGRVVPVGDPQAISMAVEDAIRSMAAESMAERKARHDAVEQRYSLQRMVEQTRSVLLRLCADEHPVCGGMIDE